MTLISRIRASLAFRKAVSAAFQGDTHAALSHIEDAKKLGGDSYVSPHILDQALCAKAGRKPEAVEKFRIVIGILNSNTKFSDATRNYVIYYMKSQMDPEDLTLVADQRVFDPAVTKFDGVSKPILDVFSYVPPKGPLLESLIVP